MMNVEIPNGFYLLIADRNTGHILNLDGSLYSNGMNDGKPFFIHKQSWDEIVQCAHEILKEQKGLEVCLYDSNNNFLKKMDG